MGSIREELLQDAVFLVWGPPTHSRRSAVLQRELGVGTLQLVYSTTRRGMGIAPYKYGYQFIKTLWLLARIRPRLVFVQNPPSLAVVCVYLFSLFYGTRYVVDAHSDALQRWYWTRPAWLTRLWARAAITTLVTNEHFQRQIEAWGGHAFVLRDIPTRFDKQASYPVNGGFVNGGFNVAVVNTFAADEPLDQVLEAASALPQVQFYVTGKKKAAVAPLLATAPDNVHFTDYLPDKAYYGLLNTSDAVMCLTTRNHTMQRGACEALSLGKPIITSDWPLLRDYFHRGTIHVDNTSRGIGQGVQTMMERYDDYQLQIRELQVKQQQEWAQKVQSLLGLIQASFEE